MRRSAQYQLTDFAARRLAGFRPAPQAVSESSWCQRCRLALLGAFRHRPAALARSA